MFIIILTYKAPIEQIDELLSAHRLFLDKHYISGHFIASGRQNPRVGGVILCRAANRDEVETIVSQDPFNAVATYQILEFESTKCMPGLEQIMLDY